MSSEQIQSGIRSALKMGGIAAAMLGFQWFSAEDSSTVMAAVTSAAGAIAIIVGLVKSNTKHKDE